jgi:lipoate-protein ligase A
MLLLDHTLDTPAENLALDEALLESAASNDEEVLRIWESQQLAVVLGRSSRAAEEVNLRECELRSIPVTRRSSGGATVVIGPGCLMYSVVLSFRRNPRLRQLDHAHRMVLDVVAAAVSEQVENVSVSGISDLTLAGRKFSGNSLRCKRDQLLYHGTLLYDFPLEVISSCLHDPPRRPEYRQNRSHLEFVTNLPVIVEDLRLALARHWKTDGLMNDWPVARTLDLAARKYSDQQWTLCR